MIIGIGTDLLDIRRIERVMSKRADFFMQRCFTESEIEAGMAKADYKLRMRFFAKRFAAKEAVIKAVGVGASAGMTMKAIEIINNSAGKPQVRLHGAAQEALAQQEPAGQTKTIHLSLSDEPPYVQAFAVIETW